MTSQLRNSISISLTLISPGWLGNGCSTWTPPMKMLIMVYNKRRDNLYQIDVYHVLSISIQLCYLNYHSDRDHLNLITSKNELTRCLNMEHPANSKIDVFKLSREAITMVNIWHFNIKIYVSFMVYVPLTSWSWTCYSYSHLKNLCLSTNYTI